MIWLDLFKHLLPRARAWRITVDKKLRQFFQGLTILGEDARGFFDGAYNDLNPELTRELDAWERQFALPDTGLTIQQRRSRLDATWKALGGQSPRYIQDTLQAAGFDVFIHEWWEPIPGRLNGGSINGDVAPVPRDPFQYLDDGTTTSPWVITDGSADAMDGSADAMDGRTLTPVGYPLVNRVLVSTATTLSDGAAVMQDGNVEAMDGFTYEVYNNRKYTIPADPTKYPFFLYIGGAVFPDQATVPAARREEFENLCLKICPTEQWLGILVKYN